MEILFSHSRCRRYSTEKLRKPLMRVHRSILIMFLMMFVGVLAVESASAQAAQQQKPLMVEDVFKNVQILKGIPVDEFMDTMGFFAAATSLNCTSCHASDNTTTWDKFAVDTPLKQTARRMMNMVNAINKTQFKGVRSVTCYT